MVLVPMKVFKVAAVAVRGVLAQLCQSNCNTDLVVRPGRVYGHRVIRPARSSTMTCVRCALRGDRLGVPS